MICKELSLPHVGVVGSVHWNLVWRTIDQRVRALIANASVEHQISERDLLVSIRLHLPRLTIEDLMSAAVLRVEVDRVASRMRLQRQSFLSAPPLPEGSFLKRGSVCFAVLDKEVARIIHERFHYAGSFREGLHFGLFDLTARETSELPLTMATLSVLDVEHLQRLMPGLGGDAEGLILSRVYSFDHAPRNSISYILGRVAEWLRANRAGVRVLFTYVNPNLGFTGVSYRAANWRETGKKSISYRYIGDKYASARQCEAKDSRQKPVVVRSPYHFIPLDILSYALVKRGS